MSEEENKELKKALILARIGYHYSEYNIDEIIDCLLYGTHHGLSFNGFMELMKDKGGYQD